MFGNKMMDKLQAMKGKMEESKARLSTVLVEGEAMEGAVKVIMNGNREVKEVILDDKMMTDKNDLQNNLVLAVNRALEKAEGVNAAEMQSAASGMLPPGFGG